MCDMYSKLISNYPISTIINPFEINDIKSYK